MTTEVKRLAETIRVTEVTKILITEIVDDAGRKVRALRIWGSDGQGGPPILEVQVEAAEADAIEITTPEIRF